MKGEIRYPNFLKETIDIEDASSSRGFPRSIISFPFTTRGKRRTDLISLSFGAENGLGSVVMMENAHNWDSTKTTRPEDDYDRWDKIAIRDVPSPSYALPADISGNRYNDVIVTCEYGESLDKMDPFGGRICWFENPGTDADDGDWIQRDIGRFPGVNLVKVGHFTTTFSLQILAVAKSSKPDVPSPLIVFTKPSDVYTSRQWLFAVALDASFTAIQDFLVVKSRDDALDHVIVSSQQGLSVARYSNRLWHHKALSITLPGLSYLPGQLCAGAIGKNPTAFIVCGECQKGGLVTVLRKDPYTEALWDSHWTPSVLGKFGDDSASCAVQDIICVDIDGDDVDEIFVSVQGPGIYSGIYMFDLQGDRFVKFKIFDEPASSIASGIFGSKRYIDLAIITNYFSSSVSILHNHFIPSHIRPVVCGSDLTFILPRRPSFVSEADVLCLCGFTLSVVILPPDASFHLSSFDGTEAVKLLHGSLGWIDQTSDGGIIERTRFPGAPGRAISMIVDCHDGLVRSGNDGAVFIRWRPSSLTDDMSLRTLNVLPSYFPCDVREHVFNWGAIDGEGKGLSKGKGFQAPGFRVCFEEDGFIEDLAHLNFMASIPGCSLDLYSRPEDTLFETSTVCLTNSSGDGSITWNESHGGRQLSSFVPRLHEFYQPSATGMRWRTSSKTVWSGAVKPNVIVSFVLPRFDKIEHSGSQTCILSSL